MKDEKLVEFLRGIAFSVTIIMKYYDQPVIAKEIIQSAGYTLEEYQHARIDKFDLVYLKKLFKTELKNKKERK